MTRIAHLTDVHFGRIAYPEIVEVLVAEVDALAADLVIVSGDLTQRARPWQFEEAVAMLKAFTAPVLVIPGNHDVYAWWHRPFLRMFNPLRRYRQYVTEDMTPTFERDGVAVLGVNSAFGWTIKHGWIRRRVHERIVSFFGEPRGEAFKILAIHHHLTRIDALGNHDVAYRARPTFEAVAEAGVDLVLCGHLHVAHVEAAELVPGRRLVIASGGTATCNRWREPQIGANYYNVIEVTPGRFTIEARRYDPSAHVFRREDLKEFDR